MSNFNYYEPPNMVKILPPELVKLIVSYVPDAKKSKDCDFEASPYRMNTWPNVGTPTAASKRRLAKLRLVSSDFWAAASPLLFKQLAIVYEPEANNSQMLALAQTICEGPCRVFVREVKIGLSHKTDPESEGLESFIQDISNLLRSFLWQLPNIESLIIRRPMKLAARRREPGDDWTTFNHAAKSFLDVVFKAIRYNKFPKLTRLSVTLPAKMQLENLTDGERTCLVTPIKDLVGRLQYLDINLHGDSKCRHYTNAISELFNNVSAGTLEHLSIVATQAHKLDLDEYFHNRCFLCLHTLRLGNVDLSADALNSLLEHNVRTMCRIGLYSVSLIDGLWHNVLFQVLRLERLCHFDINRCAYAVYGSSHSCRPDIIRTHYHDEIRSKEGLDFDYLYYVKRKVLKNKRTFKLEQSAET